MLKPSADLIIGPDDNRYALIVGVSKRAREIVSESEERGEILVEKPVDLAVHELKEHKYSITKPEYEN